jgi:hypothetical protein
MGDGKSLLLSRGWLAELFQHKNNESNSTQPQYFGRKQAKEVERRVDKTLNYVFKCTKQAKVHTK